MVQFYAVVNYLMAIKSKMHKVVITQIAKISVQTFVIAFN